MNERVSEPDRRRALAVVRAMAKEIARQVAAGDMDRCTAPDSNGRVDCAGTLDLAMLAWVAEQTLLREFGPQSSGKGRGA